MLTQLAAFLGVAALVICTPGQDTALTIRNVLGGGRRSGLATAAGVVLGQAVSPHAHHTPREAASAEGCVATFCCWRRRLFQSEIFTSASICSG